MDLGALSGVDRGLGRSGSSPNVPGPLLAEAVEELFSRVREAMMIQERTPI